MDKDSVINSYHTLLTTEKSMNKISLLSTRLAVELQLKTLTRLDEEVIDELVQTKQVKENIIDMTVWHVAIKKKVDELRKIHGQLNFLIDRK